MRPLLGQVGGKLLQALELVQSLVRILLERQHVRKAASGTGVLPAKLAQYSPPGDHLG